MIFHFRYDCADRVAKEAFRSSKVSLFSNLEEYIEQLTEFSDLEFENFHYIFLFYFLICSFVFGAFCVHHLVNLAKKRNYLRRFTSSLKELIARVHLSVTRVFRSLSFK